ncbi:DUF922 domain-containing protein [Mucilaginibacter koreensis]
MYLKLVRWSGLLAVCLLLSSTLMAQPWHRLTMDDFWGYPPGTNSAFVAYTNCQISYSYDARIRNGQYVLTFYVNMNMNHQKSWMNKVHAMESGKIDEILRHEQGHYNMAYLEQQELLQAFNQTRYGPNYPEQVKQIFTSIDTKYRNLNQDYESDTMHMLDRDRQNQWNAWFGNQISSWRNYAYRERNADSRNY